MRSPCLLARGSEVLPTSFVNLYPGTVTPKLNFLIHYPRLIDELGSLKQFRCMRFEAKHQYVKSLAVRVKNFKNVSKSVAERHQPLQCFQFATFDLDSGIATTKAKPLACRELPDCAKDFFSTTVAVWEVGSARIGHCSFRPANVVMMCKDLLPLFGQI